MKRSGSVLIILFIIQAHSDKQLHQAPLLVIGWILAQKSVQKYCTSHCTRSCSLVRRALVACRCTNLLHIHSAANRKAFSQSPFFASVSESASCCRSESGSSSCSGSFSSGDDAVAATPSHAASGSGASETRAGGIVAGLLFPVSISHRPQTRRAARKNQLRQAVRRGLWEGREEEEREQTAVSSVLLWSCLQFDAARHSVVRA